jgi:hypothetical protein
MSTGPRARNDREANATRQARRHHGRLLSDDALGPRRSSVIAWPRQLTLTSRLRLAQPVLERARQELLDRDLIAHQLPLVQVLSLPSPGVCRRPEPGQGLIRLGELFRQSADAPTPDPRRNTP